MQIDDDLEAVRGSPPEGALDIRQLALDVWFTGGHVPRPITNRETDVI